MMTEPFDYSLLILPLIIFGNWVYDKIKWAYETHEMKKRYYHHGYYIGEIRD